MAERPDVYRRILCHRFATRGIKPLDGFVERGGQANIRGRVPLLAVAPVRGPFKRARIDAAADVGREPFGVRLAVDVLATFNIEAEAIARTAARLE